MHPAKLTLFALPDVVSEPAGDGGVRLRSAEPLGAHPVTVIHSLRRWALEDPAHPLVAERAADGSWRRCTYGMAVAAADAIGQALLDMGLGPDRPLMILSGNGVDHMLMTLAAMTAGIPAAPVSVAYSLQSRDHARVRAVAGLIRPGAVFADDSVRFGPGLDAVSDVPAIVCAGGRPGARPLAELMSAPPGPRLAEAFSALHPDGIAKILFTSGSTGRPKGALNTHRMLAANQQMMRQVWPFLTEQRPVIVDWLPWSHTFGGNFNMNMIITNGGTLYVDSGRPAPGMFGPSITNLTDVPPTIYFNVPAGYAQLVPALEHDQEFARRFFSRLRLVFNAAAALPGALRERLATLAELASGRTVPVTGAWGATETGPAVTAAHFDYADARCIGVPLPGTEVRLAPAEEGYEIRVKGPNVTPGYFERPDLTAEAFDGEGFYRTGDAVAFADPHEPNAGLVFRGRIAEDFKLATGTFVRVGMLRTALLSCAPMLADAVITGEDRPFVGALAWLNAAEARAMAAGEPDPRGDLIVHEPLQKALTQALDEHNAGEGSATRIERLAVMAHPPDLDDGEITDKGYVNQRRVLARRAALTDLLYADPPPAGVVIATSGA